MLSFSAFIKHYDVFFFLSLFGNTSGKIPRTGLNCGGNIKALAVYPFYNLWN
jgi:hypothetical protein